MTRRHFSFPCEGETLAATLDDAPGKAGLLLVSGGNEIRSGTFAGQAQLAARIAEAGYPVLRFDRRGVGDSTGENGGFTGSEADIGAALDAFRKQTPDLKRVVAFGNCDAASALMLFAGAGCDALVLANPWTFESDDAGPLPQAVRARYGAKLRNPREVLRLLTGGVSLRKLARGLRQALRPAAPPTSLAQQTAAGMARFGGPVRYLVAAKDRTGQAFASAFPELPIATCLDAGHAFAEPHARDWLFVQLIAALDEQARQLDMG